MFDITDDKKALSELQELAEKLLQEKTWITGIDLDIEEGVTLENKVFCGPSVVFTNVKFPVSNKKVLKKDYKKTIVKKGATLGANSTIICGITIGENSLVGAGSVITKNVKKKSLALTRSVQVEIKNYRRKTK